MALEFNELLGLVGFDPEGTRLVRHHDTRPECIRSPYSLWRSDPKLFERYQSIQSREKFKGASYLASFVKTPANETLFVGIYKVNGVSKAPAKTIDPATDFDCGGYFLYNITKLDTASEFVGKLTIDWGSNFRVWVQDASTQSKNVKEFKINIEELPFPGYFTFRCRLSEVGSLPPAWIERIKAVKGVYVLTSPVTAEHYIGSASGQGGFFQRWQTHAAVGGAAVGLQAHGAADYQVAILQVATGFESDDDILRIEHHWMDKLQTRGMGLNGQPRESSSTPPQELL